MSRPSTNDACRRFPQVLVETRWLKDEPKPLERRILLKVELARGSLQRSLVDIQFPTSSRNRWRSHQFATVDDKLLEQSPLGEEEVVLQIMQMIQ